MRTALIPAIVACAVVLLLPGCDSDSGGTSAPADRPSPTLPAPGPASSVRTSAAGPATLVPPAALPAPSRGPAVSSAPAATGGPTSPPGVALPDTAPACADGQVLVGGGPVTAAAGHQGLTLRFWLVGASGPCSLTGYPGVDAIGDTTANATRTLRGYLGGLPPDRSEPATVVLTQDHGAQAVVEGTTTDASGNACPAYTGLRVTPPDTTDTVPVSEALSVCDLAVHPVMPMS
ncbi:DUF4232 domain-containing protein [Nocardia sp. NPDC050718]|uniref:DUF4232 domain-containing protein n=1 Tax=Nocardia sp. NPDC050718 TaxID=3155788 RepID=UPI0033E9CEF5